MNSYFYGYYLKHQKDDHTLCIIAGQSETEKFIQVITKEFSVKAPFTKGNSFSPKGIRLNIETPELTLKGRIRYSQLSPIRYSIMGPFSVLPMECSHEIVSMGHGLEGKVRLNGKVIDFTGGTGYIEGDRGCSFPSSYAWIQANDFSEPCSVMAAAADIPFCGFHFQGCICVIQWKGREYRLATYLGGRAVVCSRNRICIRQGKYRLDIRIKEDQGWELQAPEHGRMVRKITETAACPAEFRFFIREKCVFHLHSAGASFEYEEAVER